MLVTQIFTHKNLCDLPQLCDDTLFEFYCWTPQLQTAGIVTHFVCVINHQNPPQPDKPILDVETKVNLYLRNVDEQRWSRVLGDRRVLKHHAYKFNIRKSQLLSRLFPLPLPRPHVLVIGRAVDTWITLFGCIRTIFLKSPQRRFIRG